MNLTIAHNVTFPQRNKFTIKAGAIVPAQNVVVAPAKRLNAQKNNVTQIERARIIKRTLGTKAAAYYLKTRGWSVEASVYVLAQR